MEADCAHHTDLDVGVRVVQILLQQDGVFQNIESADHGIALDRGTVAQDFHPGRHSFSFRGKLRVFFQAAIDRKRGKKEDESSGTKVPETF